MYYSYAIENHDDVADFKFNEIGDGFIGRVGDSQFFDATAVTHIHVEHSEKDGNRISDTVYYRSMEVKSGTELVYYQRFESHDEELVDKVIACAVRQIAAVKRRFDK